MASVESYKHIAAKAVLAGWLRRAAAEAGGYDASAEFCGIPWRVNRPGPGFGIWEEFPVTESMVRAGRVDAWDEQGHAEPPRYQILIEAGNPPRVIFDIAVQHKGWVPYAFEVVHRSPPTAAKIDLLTQLDCCTLVVDAEWILTRIEPPSELEIVTFHGGGREPYPFHTLTPPRIRRAA